MKRFFLFLTLIPILFYTLYPIRYTLIADVTSGSNASAFVTPQTDNFQLSITEDTPYPVPEETTMTYSVTYGALLSAAVTTTNVLTVTYGPNTFDGTTLIADYVIGSATNGFGGAQPVVDLINHKITWTLSDMPPGTTDQIVTFQLRTNSKYTALNQIPIITAANMYNQYVTMPTQTHQINYLYQQPTNQVKPSPTPAPQTQPSPTPAPKPSFFISDISFTEIAPTEITLLVTTNKKSTTTTFYGSKSLSLFQTSRDTSLNTTHVVHLTKLTPSTQYFLKVITTDESGKSISSGIITFKTPKSASTVSINQQSIILVSGNNPLITTDPLLPFAQVLIPNTKSYTIGLRITSPENIKSILALVENSRVLGTNTFTTDPPNFWSAPMREQHAGIFIAQLAAPPTPSIYDVFAKISDNSGNISQTKIAEAIVYGPIKVVNNDSDKGVEHARLYLSQYNSTSRDYQPILSSDIQSNPIYTDKNGEAVINTGEGKYKVTVSQYGYKNQTTYFSIDRTHIFPPVTHLENVGITLTSLVQYYSDAARDFLEQAYLSFQNFTDAFRYFKLVSIFVSLSLIIVTFLLFLIRTKLSLIVIPLFIKHHAQKIGIAHGQILDAITHQAIPLAVVAISNKLSHEVLQTTTTNNKGIFYLKSDWVTSDNNLNILAQGYRTNKFAVDEEIFPAVIYMHHNLVGGPFHHPVVASIIGFISLFFETSLVISFILEIFFIPTIGILSLVFVFISLGTLFLWILYQRGQKP